VDPASQVFNRLFDGLSALVTIGAVIGTLLWLIKTFIDQRRWLRVARTQSEVHGKLLDRLANNEDLLAYIQTSAGRRFLESGPLVTEADPRPATAPLSRILLSLQAGVVLTCLGIGFWLAQTRFPSDMSEGFFIIGILAMALGIGFALSAALAYAVSARFGLVPSPPLSTHD
jgi:hypothetical protein